jgi:hypothetical protein
MWEINRKLKKNIINPLAWTKKSVLLELHMPPLTSDFWGFKFYSWEIVSCLIYKSSHQIFSPAIMLPLFLRILKIIVQLAPSPSC